MAGDGVSLPTQLAQIGTVAKTQARAQQAAQPATNFHDQQGKDDSLKAQRVQETEQANKSKVDPDGDRRQERRKRRQRKKDLQDSLDEDQTACGDENENQEEDIGRLIDLHA